MSVYSHIDLNNVKVVNLLLEEIASMEKRRSSPNLAPKVSMYMPPELSSQILARLPTKTLLRFRSVCKSWCSIIDHPDFVRMHARLCNNNSHNKLLLNLNPFGPRRLDGLILTVHDFDTLNKTDHNSRCIFGCYTRLGSCKGLFLVHRRNHDDEDVRVWNPSISKSLILPPCPLVPCLCTGDILYVFSFARNSEDYKVIAISFEYGINIIRPIRLTWAVFSLIDQQWTVRNNNELNLSPLFVHRVRSKSHFPSNAFYFEGASYWFGCDPSTVEDSYKSYEYQPDLEITEEIIDMSITEDNLREDDYEETHLVSLDIDTEKFTFLKLPYGLDRFVRKFLFVLEESLALFIISYRSSEIWVLNDHEGRRWTQWFSGNSSLDGFNLFVRCPWSPIFYSEKDGGRFICGNKSYNIVTCEVQEINKSLSDCVQFETYTESLVLCKGYGAANMTLLPSTEHYEMDSC